MFIIDQLREKDTQRSGMKDNVENIGTKQRHVRVPVV